MPSTSHRMPDPFRRGLPAVAVLAWCGMIFWFSAQPDLTVSADDTLDFILRKAAHMFVFGVLLLLVMWMLSRTFQMAAGRAQTLLAFVLVLAYAVADEWHQTFTPGRVGHAQDVAIDMAGAIVTFGLFTLLTRGTPWRRPPT